MKLDSFKILIYEIGTGSCVGEIDRLNPISFHRFSFEGSFLLAGTTEGNEIRNTKLKITRIGVYLEFKSLFVGKYSFDVEGNECGSKLLEKLPDLFRRVLIQSFMYKIYFYYLSSKDQFEIQFQPKKNEKNASVDDGSTKRNQQSIFVARMSSKKYQEENKNTPNKQDDFSLNLILLIYLIITQHRIRIKRKTTKYS